MNRLVFAIGTILVFGLGGCQTERPSEPPAVLEKPDILGEWYGTLTYAAYYDSDSVDMEIVWTRFSFTDKTFTWGHLSSDGSQRPWYHCQSDCSTYELTDSTLGLNDCCPYPAIVDGRIMPAPHYRLRLDHDHMVLRFFMYNAAMQAEICQTIELRRQGD